MSVYLRPVLADDLPRLFEFQCDSVACELAAVIPRTQAEFTAHWSVVLADDSILSRAIVADDELVGSISCFFCESQLSVGYWIRRSAWGQGIATRALVLLLNEESRRPIHARVAVHNVGSRRVLEKCGFRVLKNEWSEATDRFQACEEVFLILDDAP